VLAPMKRAISSHREGRHFNKSHIIRVQANANMLRPRLRFRGSWVTIYGIRPGLRWGYFQFERQQGLAVLSLLVFS